MTNDESREPESRPGSRDPRVGTARRSIARLAVPLALVFLAAAGLPALSLQRFESSEPHMGTLVRITVYASSREEAEAASRVGFDRIAALDRTLSDYRADSELSKLAARAGTGPVQVSDDLFTVLAASERLAQRTDGAFDMTAGALTHLWRRARRLSELPAAERVEEARARSGHRWLSLDAAARTATLAKAGMELDAGGLAKGYAADEARAAIGRRGVTRALVAIGGDISAGDPPPGRTGWDVAFETLSVPGAPRIPALSLHHAAVSTSGDSEQWMNAGGVRYSHILDLRTGWPMTGRSATSVVAPRGLDADALDTAAAILGPDAGGRLIENEPGAAAFWIFADEHGSVTVRRSSRWPGRSSRGSSTARSS